MAYFTPFTRVTFGGSLADGNEIWNCGFAIVLADTANPLWADAIEVVADDITDLIKEFWSNGLMSTPHGALLEYVKFASIDEDGKYTEAPVVKSFTPVPGNLTGAYVPQISTVVTLQSSKFKDPGKYNRFYLPVGNLSGSDVYELPTIEQGRLADAAEDLMNGIWAMTAGTVACYPIVASNSSSLTDIYPVYYVKVGRVLDTQRRRRNKLPESYTVRTLDS